jgi:hypothetical protein
MAMMFPIDPPPGADDLSYRAKQDVVVAAGGALEAELVASALP